MYARMVLFTPEICSLPSWPAAKLSVTEGVFREKISSYPKND